MRWVLQRSYEGKCFIPFRKTLFIFVWGKFTTQWSTGLGKKDAQQIFNIGADQPIPILDPCLNPEIINSAIHLREGDSTAINKASYAQACKIAYVLFHSIIFVFHHHTLPGSESSHSGTFGLAPGPRVELKCSPASAGEAGSSIKNCPKSRDLLVQRPNWLMGIKIPEILAVLVVLVLVWSTNISKYCYLRPKNYSYTSYTFRITSVQSNIYCNKSEEPNFSFNISILSNIFFQSLLLPIQKIIPGKERSGIFKLKKKPRNKDASHYIRIFHK